MRPVVAQGHKVRQIVGSSPTLENEILNISIFFALMSSQSTALITATQHVMSPEFIRNWGTEFPIIFVL